MAALTELSILTGKWQGTNHLWLSPEEPVQKSESKAEIYTISQDQFTEIHYTWAYENKPQEGRLILGEESGNGNIKAVWFDTWHMRELFMVCAGSSDHQGIVKVQGTYAAPPGPDWGWQISIEAENQDAFKFLMHNIAPEGVKELAVEVAYSRLE